MLLRKDFASLRLCVCLSVGVSVEYMSSVMIIDVDVEYNNWQQLL